MLCHLQSIYSDKWVCISDHQEKLFYTEMKIMINYEGSFIWRDLNLVLHRARIFWEGKTFFILFTAVPLQRSSINFDVKLLLLFVLFVLSIIQRLGGILIWDFQKRNIKNLFLFLLPLDAFLNLILFSYTNLFSYASASSSQALKSQENTSSCKKICFLEERWRRCLPSTWDVCIILSSITAL